MARVSDFATQLITPIETTVESGETLSSEINISGTTISGFYTPAALTSTTMTIQASFDGTNFSEVYDTTTQLALSIPLAANSFIPLDPMIFYGVRMAKFSMASAEAADRVFTIIPYAI